MIIPVRTALGVTCPTPPMTACMLQKLALSSLLQLPQLYARIGVCARSSARVGHRYVSIRFQDPAPTTPGGHGLSLVPLTKRYL